MRSIAYSVKSIDQITQAHSPLYPADPVTFSYNGEDLPVYNVPLPDGTTRQLALVRGAAPPEHVHRPGGPGRARRSSGRARGGPSSRCGSSRRTGRTSAKVWDLIDYPRLLLNTVIIAVISTIGTLISCTLVAYGFARFRFPGRSLLFTLLIATIFLPAAVTIIPTYTIFQRIGWVGTWLPLLVPAFFANAYDVFLMRQYFMTIPTDLDEAAAIDGAGPFRTLISVVLPQAWPVIVAVAVFHLVYSWNDFFGPLLYTAGKVDLQTVALGLQRFNGIYYREPGLDPGRAR